MGAPPLSKPPPRIDMRVDDSVAGVVTRSGVEALMQSARPAVSQFVNSCRMCPQEQVGRATTLEMGRFAVDINYTRNGDMERVGALVRAPTSEKRLPPPPRDIPDKIVKKNRIFTAFFEQKDNTFVYLDADLTVRAVVIRGEACVKTVQFELHAGYYGVGLYSVGFRWLPEDYDLLSTSTGITPQKFWRISMVGFVTDTAHIIVKSVFTAYKMPYNIPLGKKMTYTRDIVVQLSRL